METIEIDCPPGGCRPWDLIEGVVQDTPAEKLITARKAKAQGAFFGAACYEFDIPREVWVAEVQPVIMPRITALHASGTIRYGSW